MKIKESHVKYELLSMYKNALKTGAQHRMLINNLGPGGMPE